MEPYTFVVFGKAAPQGSKVMTTTGRGKTFMRESSNRLGAWRTAVKRAALGPDGLPGARFDGPVQVEIEFEFCQPKSNEDTAPTARHFGDVDKLSRGVLDALVMSGLIAADSFVVGLFAKKLFGADDRATVTVTDVLSIKPEPLKLSDPNPFKTYDLGPCVGCGEGDEGNHADGHCVLGPNY
jgi:Holliday junction resolvase RusA-like endonuclease